MANLPVDARYLLDLRRRYFRKRSGKKSQRFLGRAKRQSRRDFSTSLEMTRREGVEMTRREGGEMTRREGVGMTWEGGLAK